MSILNRRRRILVEMNCACPQPASPTANPAVKQQFVPLVFVPGRSKRPQRVGCAKCGVKVQLTPISRKQARDV